MYWWWLMLVNYMFKSRAQPIKKKDSVNIKWVKKAKLWVKTVVKDNKQTQFWSKEKPDLDDLSAGARHTL